MHSTVNEHLSTMISNPASQSFSLRVNLPKEGMQTYSEGREPSVGLTYLRVLNRHESLYIR